MDSHDALSADAGPTNPGQSYKPLGWFLRPFPIPFLVLVSHGGDGDGGVGKESAERESVSPLPTNQKFHVRSILIYLGLTGLFDS